MGRYSRWIWWKWVVVVIREVCASVCVCVCLGGREDEKQMIKKRGVGERWMII